MRQEDEVNTIAVEIMTYLQRRPLASDTLDGIVHWWLVQQSIMKHKSLVERALEQMVEEGKIFKKINPNREAIYSLDPKLKPIEGISGKKGSRV